MLYEYSLHDKKRLADGIKIVICSDIGTSGAVALSVEDYKEFLKG